MSSSEDKTRYSLWLVPPQDTPLNKFITKVIQYTLPPIFPEVEAMPSSLGPHITLKANPILGPSDSSPQAWLDQLRLPDLNKLRIRLGELHVGEVFFQKLIQKCDTTPELCELAAVCRAAGTGATQEDELKWIEENFKPHLSLTYSKLPKEEVISRLDRIRDAIRATQQAGGPECLTAQGAELWLVPTAKDVAEWLPDAKRTLGQEVQWRWDNPVAQHNTNKM